MLRLMFVYWLLRLPVACCCKKHCLLQLVVATGYCCWLLRTASCNCFLQLCVATGCCNWLLQLVIATGCCGLLVANACCNCLSQLGIATGCCDRLCAGSASFWLLLLVASGACFYEWETRGYGGKSGGAPFLLSQPYRGEREMENLLAQQRAVFHRRGCNVTVPCYRIQRSLGAQKRGDKCPFCTCQSPCAQMALASLLHSSDVWLAPPLHNSTRAVATPSTTSSMPSSPSQLICFNSVPGIG